MTSWNETYLGQYCDFILGGTPKTKESAYWNGHIPWVSIVDFEVNKHLYKTEKTITERGLNESNTKLLKVKDIIISARGSVGKLVVCAKPVAFNQSCYALRSNSTDLNQDFLFYLMKYKVLELRKKAIGGVFDTIVKDTLNGLNISLPSLLDQQKIASILSTYDKLIENNTRRIEILEEMAQRIYKEWFVDFKYPGHENDELVDSELGMIPEGWLRSFEDFVDFKEGPGLRNWQYRDEGIPFLNIRTLIKNDIDLTKVQYLDPKEVESKYQHFLLKENDHVVSSSGTLGRIATIRADHLPLMLNTSIIRMRPKANNIGVWQLKHFMKSKYFQHQINAFAIGSAQPNYGPSHLKQMSIIAPTEVVSEKYENKVSSLEIQINLLVKKNNILSKTRDYLLPKLISGKVDVSDLDIDTGILDD